MPESQEITLEQAMGMLDVAQEALDLFEKENEKYISDHNDRMRAVENAIAQVKEQAPSHPNEHHETHFYDITITKPYGERKYNAELLIELMPEIGKRCSKTVIDTAAVQAEIDQGNIPKEVLSRVRTINEKPPRVYIKRIPKSE